MSNILKNINKNRRFWAVLTVFVIVMIAYGQTLGMYFWQDDSALIFKLQNPEGQAGSYGTGIIGQGPYKYLITPFVPFFHFFGLNPFGYFLIGLIAYYLSTLIFYFFSSELFQSKKIGFIATLIYAAGYIGSDTMLRISNSWQTNFGLIFTMLLFWAMLKFLKSFSKFRFYFLSILFFGISVEFIFVRSHSLIIPILALNLLFIVSSFKFIKLPWLIISQIPFWTIFADRYLNNTVGGLGLNKVINNLFQGNIEILTAFFATIGNTFIPVFWQLKFIEMNFPREQLLLLLMMLFISWLVLSFFSAGAKIKLSTMIFLIGVFFLNKLFIGENLFWYRSETDFIAGALGMYLTILVIALGITLKKINKNLQLALFFGLIILTSQIFGYFIQYQDAIFTTTHRYLSYSLIGYSLIFGSICFVFYNKILILKKHAYILAILPLIVILGNNLYLGLNHQREMIINISQPTKKFYYDLKKFVPTISKNAVFYFDVSDNNVYRQQFNNFFSVGSMPDSTALAIYYGVDRYDLVLINDYNELLYKLSKGEISINNINSFYYGSSGLIDTSATLKKLLKDESLLRIISNENWDGNLLSFPTISPLSPVLLTIEAKIVSDLENIAPLYPQNISKDNLFTLEKKLEMVSYLLSRREYYKNVSASSISQWKFQEVSFVTDDDVNTSWRSHRIHWHENRQESIIIDMSLQKKISSIIWTNWRYIHTPTFYTIDISIDGKNWKTVKQVNNGLEKQDYEFTREYFNEEVAQFVRMNIYQTFSGEEPALVEFEVVGSAFKNIDTRQASLFINNLVDYVSNEEELQQILSKAGSLLNLKMTWETDKGKREKESPINIFGNINTYEFILDAGGTKINNIIINSPSFPAKINILSSKLQNLNLDTIINSKLIKNVVEN